MVDVVPALLPEDFNHLKDEMAMVADSVSRIQIDVANGTYAPSVTWPYVRKVDSIFEQIKKQEEGMPFWEKLDFEVDLLIAQPERYISDWITAGAAGCIVHIESTEQHAECASLIRDANIELGWGIRPQTHLSELYALIEALEMPDFVQVMGNDKIGYHGVTLDENVYTLIANIREHYPELPIAVDIGVNHETAPRLVAAGVTKLISGSTILHSENISTTITQLRNLS